MASTQCPACHKTFTAREALCENWRDPAKSFGCPHCGTFIHKAVRPDYVAGLQAGIIAGGIATPAGWMVSVYFSEGDLRFLVFGSIILAGCVGLLLVDKWRRRRM